MCLIANSKHTESLRRRIAKTKRKRVRLFKVVTNHAGYPLYSPVFSQSWKAKWNLSTRRGGTNFRQSKIRCGIHVFIRRSDAAAYASSRKYLVVLPVDAELDDLVAASDDGKAVFTKVFVRHRDYEAAIANA